jgi:hypothetical protein
MNAEITEQSMNQFVEAYSEYLQPIRLWIYSKAEVLQLNDLNHYKPVIGE